MPVYTNLLRQRLSNEFNFNIFACQKGYIFNNKFGLSFSHGLHDVNGTYQDYNLYLAHFKFINDFQEKIQTEVKRKEHWNNAQEYKIYSDNIEKYLNLYSEKFSMKFDEKIFFKELEKFK